MADVLRTSWLSYHLKWEARPCRFASRLEKLKKHYFWRSGHEVGNCFLTVLGKGLVATLSLSVCQSTRRKVKLAVIVEQRATSMKPLDNDAAMARVVFHLSGREQRQTLTLQKYSSVRFTSPEHLEWCHFRVTFRKRHSRCLCRTVESHSKNTPMSFRIGVGRYKTR